MMDVGVMNGNIPAPLMAIDEDDEFFLTLSNVGQIMRPDLFEGARRRSGDQAAGRRASQYSSKRPLK
jgi:hypothetical protein